MNETIRQPIIRRGQTHAYRKGRQHEIDERIGFVARLLRAGKTKTQIHRAVRGKFSVEWRQCDRYMAHAHARIWTRETPLNSVDRVKKEREHI